MERGKVEKFVPNFHDKNKYVVHIRNLMQVLNHGLILKKVNTDRVIKFNQNALLEPFIKMNTDLRKIASNDFEKNFFKLMNNAASGKTKENLRKHRNIKLATAERRINYLVLEPNYHTAKFFTENLLAIQMKKT